MRSLETSQSSGSETLRISLGTPPRSSSPESDTLSPPLSFGSLKRSLQNRIVPPNLVGISEEVAMQKFVKMSPTMKVLGKGKGKGLELTTFTQYEAVPQLVDTSIPLKEFEIGNC